MDETIDIVTRVSDLRARVRASRARGQRVALVPTMGALHEGHLALAREAARHADWVVASIFVNPTQFGPDEDFERYPRRPEEDAAALAEAGCHLVFLPDVETIYPDGEVTYVDLDEERDAPSAAWRGRSDRAISVVSPPWWRSSSTSSSPISPSSAPRTPNSWPSCAAWCATSISTSRSSPIRPYVSRMAWRCRPATPT